MGLWKRVSEKTKQTLGVKGTDPDWKPTSNARNLAMIEEARRFSKQLKALHRELREMEARIESNFGTLRNVLSSPLPRVYEMSDKGPLPVDREAAIVGGGVAFDTLTAAGNELKAKLQNEVLHPLDQWQAAYRMIKQRNGKCEELRLELDAKRRELASFHQTLEKQKTKAATDGGAGGPAAGPTGGATGSAGGAGSPPGNKFEDAEFKLQKEEDKVSRLTQRYRDVEDEVYNALLTLINDTKVLKQYAATALVVYQHAFSQAYTAFDGATVPLPPPAPGGGSPIKTTPSTEHEQHTADLKGSQSADPAASTASTVPAGVPASTPAAPAGGSVAAAGGAPAPPAWYNEARQNAKTMRYDSDDDA